MPGSRCGAAGGPGRGARAGRRAWQLGLVVALGLCLSVGAQTPGKPDVTVTDIEFEVVPASSSASRPTLGENQAILGDAVRVRAVVQNVGTASADDFDVEFYFVERTSQETGHIGTQTVFGLAPGQVLKPAVSLNTADLAPGIYDIVVKADPGKHLSEDATDLCNNEIPRGTCHTETAKNASDYSLALLREGPTITGVTPIDRFPTCRKGPLLLSSAINATFYNVGTVTLGSSSVRADGYYRTSLADSFPQEPNLPNLRIRILTSSVKPGEEGTMTIHLSENDDFSELHDTVFQDPTTLGLGKSSPVQFRVLITPTSVSNGTTSTGLPRELILPDRRTLSNFYSEVDLWTFPLMAGCAGASSGDLQTGSTVRVPPAFDQAGIVYHVLSLSKVDRLYALDAFGRTLWQKDFPGEILTSLAVGPYDEATKSVILYFGSDKGNLYALSSRQATASTPAKYETGWTKSVGAMTSPPVVSSDGTRIIGWSTSGLFIYDQDGTPKLVATTGTPVSDIIKKAATETPVYIDATHEIWFAAGRTVYKLAENGGAVLCTHDAGSDVTALETNPSQTQVYVGTELGTLWALATGTAKGQDCTSKRSIDLRNAVRGATAVREKGTSYDLVYVTTDDGYVHRVKDTGQGNPSDTRSKDDLQLRTIKTAPAVLTDADGKVSAVVVASKYGQLRAFSANLDRVLKVLIWGSSVDFTFDTASKKDMLAPVVSSGDALLLAASADGYLYAFSLSGLLK